MTLKRGMKLPTNGLHRIKRNHRVLWYQCDIAAKQATMMACRQRQQILTSKQQFATNISHPFRQDTEQRFSHHGLTGTGLTDQATCLTRLDRQIDTPQDGCFTVCQSHLQLQILNVEDRHCRITGSSNFRSASPKVFNASTSNTIHSVGANITHQASCKY